VESGTPTVSESASETVDLGRRKFLSYGGAAAASAAIGNPLKLFGSSVVETIVPPLGATERLLMSGTPFSTASRLAFFNPYTKSLTASLQSAGSVMRSVSRIETSSVRAGATAQAEGASNSLTIRPIQQVISGRVAGAEQASIQAETAAFRTETRLVGQNAVEAIGSNGVEATGSNVAKATEVRMLTHTETPAAIDSLAENAAARGVSTAEHAEIEAQIR
jgi:hypothetical protein